MASDNVISDADVAAERARSGQELSTEDLAALILGYEHYRNVLRRLSAEARAVLRESPGSIVLYEPQALADALDAMLAGRSTEDVNEANKARNKTIGEVLCGRGWSLVLVSHTATRVPTSSKEGT
jgi:hypothetical protein